MESNKESLCTTILIKKKFVLLSKSSPKWTVLTGSEDASTGGDIHELKRPPIVHPNYNRITTDNDIALLEVLLLSTFDFYRCFYSRM